MLQPEMSQPEKPPIAFLEHTRELGFNVQAFQPAIVHSAEARPIAMKTTINLCDSI